MHESFNESSAREIAQIEEACSLHIKSLNCLKTVLKVNIRIVKAEEGVKEILIQTIKEGKLHAGEYLKTTN